MFSLLRALGAAYRFGDYKPKAVTYKSIRKWLKQFDAKDRETVLALLESVIYLSESTIRRILVEQNDALTRRLAAAGIPPKKIIYIQVHDAGSSSPVMLNMLRDAAQLERLGCRFVDSRDSLGLNKVTNEVGEGALVYIDDFVGSCGQFCAARDFAIANVVGTFSEFLLVPSICEEAIYEIGKRGIEAYAGHLHSKAERPLHDNSNVLEASAKQRMRDVCSGIRPKGALGFKDLAAMVVLYRNAPNSVPAIFRGSLNQTPFVGVFPRTTDLPLPGKIRP